MIVGEKEMKKEVVKFELKLTRKQRERLISEAKEHGFTANSYLVLLLDFANGNDSFKQYMENRIFGETK